MWHRMHQKRKYSKYVNVTAQTNTSKWEGKARAHLILLVQGAQPGLDAQEIFYRSHQAFDFFLAARTPSKMRVRLFSILLNS